MPREPGEVGAGASAEAEWTWEPPTEGTVDRRAVGSAGRGAVIRAQGIETGNRPALRAPQRRCCVR